MDEQTRSKLLRPFLDADDHYLAATWDRHWDAVAGDYIALVNQRLDHGDIGGAMRGLESQPGAGAADRLLRELVGPARGSGESWQRGIVARAELLRQRPVPAPGTFGMTRAALRLGQAGGMAGPARPRAPRQRDNREPGRWPGPGLGLLAVRPGG